MSRGSHSILQLCSTPGVEQNSDVCIIYFELSSIASRLQNVDSVFTSSHLFSRDDQFSNASIESETDHTSR